MRRYRKQKVDRWAVRRVHDIVEGELDWHFGPEPLPDYGVDALTEVVAEDDLVTGRLLGLQIKGGEYYFRRQKSEEGWTFWGSSSHLAYWLAHSLPILVVLVNPEGHAFWQVISTKTIREHKKGFSLLIPRSQPFDGTAREASPSGAG